MAGNLIDLNEAAEIIGVSPEELSELATAGKIRSFRAGSSIRFKREELDAYLAEKSASADSELKLAPDSGIGLADSDIGLVDNESGEDSVLLSESELGGGNPSASTILRGDESGASDIRVAGDSDVKQSDDSGYDLADESAIDLGGEESTDSAHDSDVSLVPDPSGSSVNLVAGDSDIPLQSDIYQKGQSASKSGILGDSSGNLFDEGVKQDSDADYSSDIVLDDSASEISLTGDSDSNRPAQGSDDISLDMSDDDLSLGDSADDLSLEDSGDLELPESSDVNLGGSDSDLSLEASGIEMHDSDIDLDGSAIELGEDDDLVLGGSSISSDLSLTGDSGINLQPTDSGLSLDEEPLELGGSGIDALELPEDDDILELESEPADADAATMARQQDGDFFLTPSEDADDDDESGSQVIALEESGYVDPDQATMIGGGGVADAGFDQPGMGAAAPLVAQDDDMFRQPGETVTGGGAGAAQPVPAQAPAAPAAATEMPYSIWNVLGLLVVFMFVLMSLMLMVDVVSNVWSFNEPYSASTMLMDELVKALSMDP